jgi:hypothetical protein
MTEVPRELFQTDLHVYGWSDGEVQLEQFKQGGESFSALITVLDRNDNLLEHSRVNLIAPQTRKGLAKTLSGGRPDLLKTWEERLLHITYTSGVKWREGGSVLRKLADVKVDKTLPAFLMPPIVIEKGVVVVYGDGSAGKSMLTLAWLLTVCTGHPFTGMLPTRTGPVVYFDWEDNEDTIKERAEAMCAAVGVPFPQNFYYREMDRPIGAGEERVRREIEETGAVAAVFDSMGMMLGGDPSDPVLVIPAVNVLKRAGISCLGIHHLSAAAASSSELKDKQKAYGSVYARNGARSQWLIERFQEEEADEGFLYAFQTKVNRGKKSRPMAWHISYENDDLGYLSRLTYTPRDAGDYYDRLKADKPAASLTVAEAVEQVLSASDSAVTFTYTVKGLTERVCRLTNRNVSEATVRTVLNRDRKFVAVKRDGDTFWGLRSDREDGE